MSVKKKVMLISCGSGRKNLFGNAQLPNLGLLYIATTFQDSGFDVEVVDLGLAPLAMEEILDKTKTCNFVGVSCMTWTLDEANKIASAIRAKNPNVGLIAGGSGATSMPSYLIPNFDWVCIGEGENAVRAIVGGKQAKGIVHTDRDMAWTGVLYPSRDKGMLPFLHMRDIWPLEIGDQAPTSISGSRGCPFDCSFCESREAWQGRVVFRDPIKVVDEVEYLAGQGYRSIDWDDLNINLNHEWLLAICAEMVNRGLHNKVVMGGLFNPALHHSDELIPAMREAGWGMLSIGTESPTERERQVMAKQHQDEDPDAIFKLCLKNGIATRLLMIIDVPDQTINDIGRCGDWIKSCSATGFRCSHFTPFHQSASGRDDIIRSMIIDHNLAHWDTVHPVLSVPYDSVAARRYLMESFFFNAYLKNRKILLEKFPEFKIGYRRLESESGFLTKNNLVLPENRLGKG
ncbi:MAG: radical SAM protein [Patescibacteria group bacterium]|jgi:radical SAM superfamily enzyme YgiQ (UPF0313 family)